MDILDRVSTLLGVTDKDTILSILIEDAQTEFKAYCSRDDVPESAGSVISLMVMHRFNQLGSEGITAQAFSGISQSFQNGYSENITKQLNRFRKLRVM